MATKKINDLTNVTSVKDTDLLIVETSEGTRSIDKSNLLSGVLSINDTVANANHATTADTANTANTATNATNANYANSSGNADTVDGHHVNTDIGASGLKPIYAGTSDITAGSTTLAQGNIYIVYE